MTITTNDGRQFTHALDVPKGDPRDPMTIDELEIKFNALAEPVMSEGRLSDLKSAIFDLEHLADAGNLMSLTVADR